MILSKPLTICALLGTYLYTNVNGAAYEIQMNGQTYQVNVVGQAGEAYSDRTTISDDYGILMDDQKEAICSSLRMDEYCEQVTNNGAKTHNLFNYFPSHSDESIVAHANDKFNKNTSPYLMKQTMDDRTISHLSRQNIQSLGTKPITAKHKNIATRATGASAGSLSTSSLNEIAQSLLGSAGIGLGGDAADLQHVTTRKFKYNKNKNKNKENNPNSDQSQSQIATSEDIEDLDHEEGEVEVEFYSNLEGDAELANALGLDDDEFGETVDRIVAQLVASYMDNDSDEVDVGQIFATEISADGNGDVSTEQINLDEGSMQEMSELLNNIAKKHKKKEIGDGEQEGVNNNEEEHEAQLYEVRYVVDSDTNTDDVDIDEDEQIQSEK